MNGKHPVQIFFLFGFVFEDFILKSSTSIQGPWLTNFSQ
jgi:hypothetical protein